MGVLRIFLAISVFLFHSGNTGVFRALDGGAAVFVFFVVSGFYMELILKGKYTEQRLGTKYISHFYLSRFWRLYPIYMVIFLAVLALTSISPKFYLPDIFLYNGNFDSINGLRLAISYFSNVSMIFLNLPSTKDLFIGPGWSLGIEISFYALAPYALRMAPIYLLMLSMAGIFLQFLPFGQHSPVFFGLHFFIIGALARRFQGWIENVVSRLWKPKLSALYVMVFLIVFFSIPHDIYIGAVDDHTHNSLDRLIYPILFALLIPLLHQRTEKSRFDYWVGQISYPFYLVHTVVITYFGDWVHPLKTLFLLAACIFISGALTFWEVRMIQPWRMRFSS